MNETTTTIREAIAKLVDALNANENGRPSTRELSLAKTALQEAGFWVIQHEVETESIAL